MQIRLDDLVSLFVGIGQVAHGAVFHLSLRAEGERFGTVVTRLQFHLGKVNAAAVDTGRCTGLEAAQGQTQLSQGIGKTQRRVHSVRSGGKDGLTGDHSTVQIGACGNDHGLCRINTAQTGDNTGNAAVFRQDIRDLRLLQLQTLLQLQRMLHMLLIFAAVGLRPQRVDGRSFTPVEHPVLDAAAVCRQTHFAAQHIQLPDKVTLAGAADGGIAGHIAHGIEVDGKQNGFQTQTGGSQCRLDSCVSGTDDGNITFSGMVLIHVVFLLVRR